MPASRPCVRVSAPAATEIHKAVLRYGAALIEDSVTLTGLRAIDPADREKAVRQLAVSRETLERLEAYVSVLDRWAPAASLVGRNAWPTLWTRHILDSAQLMDVSGPVKTIVDLGAGAGFPGMIVAILMRENGATVHLIESDRRKAAFLVEAARVTDSPAVIHVGRIETELPKLSEPVDLVTARAVASLTHLIAWSRETLHNGATGLFFKGKTAQAEIAEAACVDDLHIDLLPSRTAVTSHIVRVRSRHPRV
jgi:16S rRNA (guanine527-N7)-methyltransferase